jgi:hypothetical protein
LTVIEQALREDPLPAPPRDYARDTITLGARCYERAELIPFACAMLAFRPASPVSGHDH